MYLSTVNNNNNNNNDIVVRVACEGDTHYAQQIVDEMASSAKVRGTGIAKRSPEYVAQKCWKERPLLPLPPPAYG
ncbi:hypothetical protein [Arachidicoccus ginsenosidivorans]|uniref:hypothetical protein n=1 Tax=Arachidicoccus ginsenosidivorans TaxID=496057 RepID=UPI001CEF8733|nr:hypothetical protein [Arachidicoccus ginsenosidivorans]